MIVSNKSNRAVKLALLFILIIILCGMIKIIVPDIQKRWVKETIVGQAYHEMNLGEKTSLFSSSELQHKKYLKITLSSDDTYEIEFQKKGKSNKIVVSSGAWAGANADGVSKTIVHLIPAYIVSRGYDNVRITPILGDGKYSVKDFSLLDDIADISEHTVTNIIDFEIKQYEIEIEPDDYRKLENK